MGAGVGLGGGVTATEPNSRWYSRAAFGRRPLLRLCFHPAGEPLAAQLAALVTFGLAWAYAVVRSRQAADGVVASRPDAPADASSDPAPMPAPAPAGPA